MQNKYRMFRRGGGVYYAKDKISGQAKSLETKDRCQAERLLAAKNQAAEQPHFNLSMARVYLSEKNPELVQRTWDDVMREMELSFHGPTLRRWQTQMRCAPFRILGNLKLFETDATHFFAVLRHPRAGSSTLKWLRILHNRALDFGWLLVPVLARKLWPKLPSRKIVAITHQQHQRLVDTENDSEFKLYLQILWETGGAQSDIACLHRDNVDLARQRLMFSRRKLEHRAMGEVAIVIGENLGRVLAQLPLEGYLFPTLAKQDDKVRASRFRKVADRLGFKDISLHSYRYAWAQRAKTYGMPLREAMAHLGHGSKAIHQAYSEKADVVTFPLEYYEKMKRQKEEQLRKQMSDLNDENDV